MVSLTQPNGDYALQPALQDNHRESLKWTSATELWQNELSFLQKLLDSTAHLFRSMEDKKSISHFQNLFIYYRAEVVIDLREKLFKHESRLADIIAKREISHNPYYREHLLVTSELEQFSKQFTALKNDFFKFIEKLK